MEYDQINNEQREIIYAERRKVLDGEDLSSTIEGMIHYVIDTEVEDAFAGADHCDDPEKLASDLDALTRAIQGLSDDLRRGAAEGREGQVDR